MHTAAVVVVISLPVSTYSINMLTDALVNWRLISLIDSARSKSMVSRFVLSVATVVSAVHFLAGRVPTRPGLESIN